MDEVKAEALRREVASVTVPTGSGYRPVFRAGEHTSTFSQGYLNGGSRAANAQPAR